MKKLILLVFIFHINNIFSQEVDSYLPIIIDKEINYKWMGKESKHSFTDSISISGKTYFSYQKRTKENSIITLINISNDTVYEYNEYLKKHIPKFTFNSKVGEKVGRGKIIHKNKSFKNPKGKIYKNLIVIELQYHNGKLFEYYKKGLGLVAIKNEKKFILYINE